MTRSSVILTYRGVAQPSSVAWSLTRPRPDRSALLLSAKSSFALRSVPLAGAANFASYPRPRSASMRLLYRSVSLFVSAELSRTQPYSALCRHPPPLRISQAHVAPFRRLTKCRSCRFSHRCIPVGAGGGRGSGRVMVRDGVWWVGGGGEGARLGPKTGLVVVARSFYSLFPAQIPHRPHNYRAFLPLFTH
jgi:hypothetical protein